MLLPPGQIGQVQFMRMRMNMSTMGVMMMMTAILILLSLLKDGSSFEFSFVWPQEEWTSLQGDGAGLNRIVQKRLKP